MLGIDKYRIVSDRAYSLSTSFALQMGKELFSLPVKRFADTESYLSPSDIIELCDKEVIVLFQFAGNQNNESINQRLGELLYIADSLKKIGVQRLIVCLPYLPYARQESFFNRHLQEHSALVGKLLKCVGVDGVVVSDVHAPLASTLFHVPFINLCLSDFWADVIQNYLLPLKGISREEACVVAPDEGARSRVEKIAKKLAVPFITLKKHRDFAQVITLGEAIEGDVSGKHVIIVDDIIDTGTTTLVAAQHMQKKGALSVTGCFSHAVLSPGAQATLEASPLEHIFVADTLHLQTSALSKKWHRVSISSFLAQAMKSNTFNF